MLELLLPLVILVPLTFAAATFGVWLWALIDAIQVPADIFYRSGSKLLWVLLIALAGPLAALIYLVVGRPDPATRRWMAAQRAAGVDLRAYRVYDLPGPGAPPPTWPGTRAGPGGPAGRPSAVGQPWWGVETPPSVPGWGPSAGYGPPPPGHGPPTATGS